MHLPKMAKKLPYRQRKVTTHKISNLRNLGIGWHIQKVLDEKGPLAKNQSVSAIEG